MVDKKEKKYLIDNPTLIAEWNYDKNNELGLDPKTLTCGSGKKVWWKCEKGHEWQAVIAKINKGRSCPYCSGRKVLKGYNDLATLNRTLAKEWNYEKNGDLRPEHFTVSSGVKVWWKCSKGHEWQATIHNRNKGSKCPVCNSERNTSFPEYAIFYYVKKYEVEIKHSYKEKGYELDIYIPSKNVAVEYDGYFYHKNKVKKDLEKNSRCQQDGITLYRIREEGLPVLNDSSIDYIVDKNQKNLTEIIQIVLYEILGIYIDINLQRDNIAIENLRDHAEKKNSILFTNTEIAKEWNHEKNGDLRPEHFTSNSHQKVWWKCAKGHEWQATIGSRNDGRSCPYCSGKYAISGESDLKTTNPQLAKEWNCDKNGVLKSESFTSNSNKKVWWKCSKGHEWQATIANRNNGRGCPYCSGRKVLNGYNDLATLNPKIASEWNYERNGVFTPKNFTANSHEKVWWKCSKGHEWQATIANRNKGKDCPYCAGQKIIKGENDLATLNPKLASEWNYEKNNSLSPMDVMPNSHQKVWWKCIKKHEWQATIASRNNGRSCPYCSGRKRDK